jgi:hypothetical protein
MKNLIRGAIISVAVAACCLAAFVAAALWAPQHQPTIRRHIRASPRWHQARALAKMHSATMNVETAFGAEPDTPRSDESLRTFHQAMEHLDGLEAYMSGITPSTTREARRST